MELHRLNFYKKWLHHVINIEGYLIKQGKFREAYNYFWVRFFSNEEGLSLTRRLYYIHPSLAPYPKRIELEATTKCFLKCPKCEQVYWDETQKNMTFEQFKRIVDMFPGLCEVSLTGIGHGFENPEYMLMLKYLKSKSIITQFFDPFLLINEARQKELIEIGMNWIWVSMDGATKETYEACQVGSNYDIVVKNLKNFIKLRKEAGARLPDLHFQYIITKTNVHEMPQMVDFVHNLMEGTQVLTTIQFIKMIPFKENRHLVPDITPEIIAAVKAKSDEYKDIDLNFVHTHTRPQPCKCVAWTVPFICVDGEVYPCCTLTEGNVRKYVQTNTLGNVYKQDFHEIWVNEKYTDLKNKLHNNEVPTICNQFKPCMLFDTENCCKKKE